MSLEDANSGFAEADEQRLAKVVHPIEQAVLLGILDEGTLYAELATGQPAKRGPLPADPVKRTGERVQDVLAARSTRAPPLKVVRNVV